MAEGWTTYPAGPNGEVGAKFWKNDDQRWVEVVAPDSEALARAIAQTEVHWAQQALKAEKDRQDKVAALKAELAELEGGSA
jgi:hypothetical protein